MTLKEQIAWIGAWMYQNQSSELAKVLEHVRRSLFRLEKYDEANPGAETMDDAESRSVDHRPYLGEYSKWYTSYIGVKPKIMSGDGAAAKRIAKYLVEVSVTQDEEGGLLSWKFILTKWKRLTPFIQKQTRLSQIEKNLPEIITQLKNGNKPDAAASEREDLERDLKGGQ